MRFTIFTLCLLMLLPMTSRASFSPSIDELLATPHKAIQRFDPDSKTENQYLIPLNYADSIPRDLNVIHYLKNNEQVIGVTLIYSDFSKVAGFDQPDLNRARLQQLKKYYPEPFKSRVVEWRFWAQVDCDNESEARALFHGFLITTRPLPTPATLRAERTMSAEFLATIEPEIDSIETKMVPHIKRKKVWSGSYRPNSKKKRAKGILYEDAGIWNRRKHYLTEYDTTEHEIRKIHYKPSGPSPLVMAHFQDTTVFSVLKRNVGWNNMLIVCDVTGSMSPYTAQLMAWFKLNSMTHQAKYFTFFNDGNRKADREKVIGRTGGIYHVETETYAAVEKCMHKAMFAGGGGDAPENNVEALLKATNKYKDADEVILIADNWAPVKDIELMTQLERPVHIILCGARSGWINVDYLDLARATGGSIHTMESDLLHLSDMVDGEIIEIDGRSYQLRSGLFYPVYKS